MIKKYIRNIILAVDPFIRTAWKRYNKLIENIRFDNIEYSSKRWSELAGMTDSAPPSTVRKFFLDYSRILGEKDKEEFKKSLREAFSEPETAKKDEEKKLS